MTYEDNIEELLGDVFCINEACNNERCEFANGHRYKPRSIYGSGKCGAWLFVHKVLFMLQEHVKTTETDETRFFFAKKD